MSKIKGFGTHLQSRHFKKSKAKTKHELQNEILGMSNQQLAVFDEIVNKSSQGKQMDHIHYPIFDIREHREISRKLKGHTHTQVALARRTREIKGGFAVGALFNATKAVATKGAKVILKTGKAALKAGSKAALKAGKAAFKSGSKAAIKAGKAALKGAKMMAKGGKAAATWALEHPQEAIMIGSTIIPLALDLAGVGGGGEEEYSEEEVAAPQREAIDTLLQDTTSDDEKDPRETKGGQLQSIRKSKGGNSRWVI